MYVPSADMRLRCVSAGPADVAKALRAVYDRLRGREARRKVGKIAAKAYERAQEPAGHTSAPQNSARDP